MAVKYLRLFDPTQQFLLKNGAINTAGLLKVKLEGTDDYAPVYDENGTQLQQPVILDNNGRAKGLFVDAAKVYWLEVDDADGYELFTIKKMSPCGGGGGSALGNRYEVQSTDGTVKVDRYESDGVVYFDLSTEITNEASVWGAIFGTLDSVPGTDEWTPVPVISEAGSSVWNDGWTAKKDCVADIAASIEMVGDPAAQHTLDVMCVFSIDGVGVTNERSQLDPTEARGKVTFEYKGEVTDGQRVDCRIFVKSVEAMSPTLVSRVYFNEECDGVVGGGGGGNNYYPGEYVDINSANVISVTGLQPVSGMSAYATQSAFDDCCSAMSGYVSGLSSDLSSLSSTVSGLTGTYVEKSSISAESAKWNEVSGLSSKLDESAFTAYTSTALSGYATEGYVDSSVSGKLDTSAQVVTATASASSVDFGYTASYATEINGLTLSAQKAISATHAEGASSATNWIGASAKLDASASSSFQPSGDYAYNSSLSGKADNSAFGTYDYYGTALVTALSGSGFYAERAFRAGEDISGRPLTALAAESSLSGKLDASASSAFYPTSNPSSFVGSSYVDSSVSGKLDASASSSFYPVDNPSGFLTGVDLTNYATTGYVDSSVSSKLDTSSIETSVDGITGIAGTSIAGGGASYTSPSGTIIVGADTLEGTDSGVGITNLTSFQKSGYFGTAWGLTATGSSNYPTIFNLSGSSDTLSLAVSSNGAFYANVLVNELNGPVVIPSGTWRVSKNHYAPMYWTAETYRSGTANVQLAHKSDVVVTSITRTSFVNYDVTPPTTSTSVSAINGEPIYAEAARTAMSAQYAFHAPNGIPLNAVITATPYSKNGTINVTGLEIEGSDSAFLPDPYVYSGTVTLTPNNWDSSFSARHWSNGLSVSTADKISRIDISAGNNYGEIAVEMQAHGTEVFRTSVSVNPYNTGIYEVKAPFYPDYISLGVSSYYSATPISSITCSAYSQESGTVVPLAHASSLPTYGYDGTAITSIDGSAIGGGGGGVDSATVSAIASSYAESAASSKQDALTFDWDADSAISSINGSALAGGGAGGASIVVTGTAWDPDTSAYVYDLSSNLSGAERHVYSSQVDGQIDYIDKFFDDSANTYRLEAALIRAGAEQHAPGLSSKFVYMPRSSMWTTADAATGVFSPLQYATGACLAMSSEKYFKAYYKGNEWFVADSRYGMVRGEVHYSRGLRIVASGYNSASGFQLHPSGVNGQMSSNIYWDVNSNGVSGQRPNSNGWYLGKQMVSGSLAGTPWQYGRAEYTSLTSVVDTVSANSASWAASGIQESALGWLEV